MKKQVEYVKVIGDVSIGARCVLQLSDGRIVFNSDKDIYVYQLDKLPDMNLPETIEGKKQFQPDHIIKDAHIACIVCMIQLHSGELCTGGEEGLIKLWSIKDNFQFVAELTGHRTKISDIIETFDGKLVSCSDDRSIKIWIP
jgi:WD40 repeat protein